MGLFNKKREEEIKNVQEERVSFASERIFFDEIDDDDEKTSHYVDLMKNGTPVVLNFEHLSVSEANKVLAFLAGAAYALGGKSVQLKEKVFLFARGQEFLDGSLREFMEGLND